MIQVQLNKQFAISSTVQLCYDTSTTKQTNRYLFQDSAVLWYNSNQINKSLSLPRVSWAMVQLQPCKQIAISSRLQLCYGTIPTKQTIRYLLQGSAVLWYNLLRNGEPDTRLVHAGCPVAIGDKWSKRLKHSNILLSVLALSHLANQSTRSPQSRN